MSNMGPYPNGQYDQQPGGYGPGGYGGGFGPRPDEKNSLGSRPGDRQSGLLQHFYWYPCDDRGLPGYAGGKRRTCHQ